MSGHKKATVTMRQEDYHRLHEAAMKQTLMPQDALWAEAAINKAMEHGLLQMEERQKMFEGMVKSLGEQVQEVEAETFQTMQLRQQQDDDRFERMQGEVKQGLDEIMRDHFAHIDQCLQEESKARRSGFERIHQMGISEQVRKREIVESWINAAEEVSGFIASQYHHERFAAGEMDKINREINQACLNLADGLEETAMVQVQSAYMELTDLRLKLHKQQSRWQVMHAIATAKAEQLYAKGLICRRVKALDLEGQLLDIEIDTEYWSARKLNRWLERMERISRQLHEEWHLFDTQYLNTMVEKMMPDLEDELRQIVAGAQLAAVQSQVRVNIADVVVQALGGQGFALIDGQYAQRDMRKGYFICLRNLAGGEVVVQVEPVPGNQEKSEMFMQSFDHEQRTEHELKRRAMEISHALGQYGLGVSQVTTMNDADGYMVENEKKLVVHSISQN